MKPLLVGEDNPYGDDPEFALYPSPDGCSGHRLYRIIKAVWPQLSREKYLDLYARRNLGHYPCPKSLPRRRELWRLLLVWADEEVGPGCRIVAVGSVARDAAGFDRDAPICRFDGRVAWIPHPSGANPELHKPSVRRHVGHFLADLVR